MNHANKSFESADEKSVWRCKLVCRKFPTMLGFAFFLLYILTGCEVTTGNAPNRDFVAADLLLSANSLGTGWESYGTRPPGRIRESWGDDKDDVAIGFSRIDYQVGIQKVYHYILPFRYFSQSAQEYEYQADDVGIFVKDPIESMLTPTSEPFASSRAQRYYAGCSYREYANEHGCTFTAQYDEYVSILRANIRPETISFDDFNELMKEVDRIMVEHLGATRPDGSTEPAQNELTMWLEKKRIEDQQMEQSTPEPLLDYLLFPWNQTLIQPASPLFTPAGEVQVTSTP